MTERSQPAPATVRDLKTYPDWAPGGSRFSEIVELYLPLAYGVPANYFLNRQIPLLRLHPPYSNPLRSAVAASRKERCSHPGFFAPPFLPFSAKERALDYRSSVNQIQYFLAPVRR